MTNQEKERTKCQGWRRHGGALSFGPPKWVQCTESPTVILRVEDKDMAACNKCWEKVIASDIVIENIKPITK